MDPKIREGLEQLAEVPLELEATVSCTRLTVAEVLELEHGSIVASGRPAGESVEIRISGRTVGQADLIVIDDALAARLSGWTGKP